MEIYHNYLKVSENIISSSSNKSNFYIQFLYNFFSLKNFRDSSAKYYPDNKERLQKKACKRYQSLSKEEKKKSNNMVVRDTKIYQKMKSKSWFNVGKKCLTIIIISIKSSLPFNNYNNYFRLENRVCGQKQELFSKEIYEIFLSA